MGPALLHNDRLPRGLPARTRQPIWGGWGARVDGPVDNLVRAFGVHLEAVQAAGCAPRTIAQYEGRYNQFLTFLSEQGHAPPFGLELLEATRVRQATNWLRERSQGRQGGTHAALALVGVLKTGSAWLADEGYLAGGLDPLARVKRPKAHNGSRVPLSQDDVQRIRMAALDSPTGLRDVAILRLLLDTGMRVGGAASILYDDLDLHARRVVLRLKGGREHALYFGSGDRRDGGGTTRALRQYTAERDRIVERWAGRGSPERSGGKLFLTYDGWPMTRHTFWEALQRMAERAHLKGVFPHRIRHTFATWYLVRHPGDETGLRGILGHLSADMFRVYSHLAHEIIAQRAGRVALSEAWLDGVADQEPRVVPRSPDPKTAVPLKREGSRPNGTLRGARGPAAVPTPPRRKNRPGSVSFRRGDFR